MNETTNFWRDWRLHIIVLVVVIVAELIGTREIDVGIGEILFLPMLYAIVIGLGLYFTPLIKKVQSKKSESLVFLSVTLLIAKFGVVAGPAIPEIIHAGPALIFQELGNIGTIFLSLPIAFALGLKRETIGMTHSIAREPNVALISEKYGISSPEGRGVMAMYIFGTVFGTIFMSLGASILVSITPLHVLSFAMATGVGSGSMTAAALGPLVSQFPELEEQITAFSGVSNLLTEVTGLYMSIFIALPLTVKLYNFLEKFRTKKDLSDSDSNQDP